MYKRRLFLTITLISILAFVMSGCLFPTKRGIVIGVVTTEHGDPLAGVTVRLGSATQITDVDGAFKFEERYGNHSLIAQMAGVTVATLNVALQEQEVAVEVIVKPVLVSAGKSYEYVDFQPSENNPDPDRIKLTDGELGRPTEYWHTGWVATRPDTPWSVILDLGLKVHIDSVRSNHLAGVAGIRWPVSWTVRVSADGSTWSDPVVLAITEPIPSEGTGEWFGVDALDQAGRFVEITWDVSAGGQHVWVSEVEVYGLPVVQ